jgi:hypothetical protein
LAGGFVLVALLSGCGGGDEHHRTAPARPRAIPLAEFSQFRLGSTRASARLRVGAAPAEATRKYAIDDHERRACDFYPLVQNPRSTPDAIRLCYDGQGRLESTSTVNVGRKAPDEPAGAGPRKNSIGKPLKPGTAPPSMPAQPPTP